MEEKEKYMVIYTDVRVKRDNTIIKSLTGMPLKPKPHAIFQSPAKSGNAYSDTKSPDRLQPARKLSADIKIVEVPWVKSRPRLDSDEIPAYVQTE